MKKEKVLQLEKLLMTLSSKYNFETKDYNEVYDNICEILNDIDVDNLHKLDTIKKVEKWYVLILKVGVVLAHITKNVRKTVKINDILYFCHFYSYRILANDS